MKSSSLNCPWPCPCLFLEDALEDVFRPLLPDCFRRYFVNDEVLSGGNDGRVGVAVMVMVGMV